MSIIDQTVTTFAPPRSSTEGGRWKFYMPDLPVSASHGDITIARLDFIDAVRAYAKASRGVSSQQFVTFVDGLTDQQLLDWTYGIRT